jgi:Cof subfamily protein (haloacid dehalogenase superfamily)
MVKLIAIDLDGTLLNDETKISRRNIEAIFAAKQKGIEVVVATGRANFDAQAFFKDLGLTPWIIATNGATIHRPDGSLFQSIPLNKNQAIEMLSQLEREQFYYEAFVENRIYAPQYGENILFDELEHLSGLETEVNVMRRGVEIQFGQSGFSFIPTYQDLLDTKYEIYNILAISYNEEKLQHGWNKFKGFPAITMVQSGKYNFHLQHEQASKGNALKMLAEELHIGLTETAAIGDNHNDISMLELVGRSAAMGNADQKVKDACDEVTLNHNEDGVALFIEAIIKDSDIVLK